MKSNQCVDGVDAANVNGILITSLISVFLSAISPASSMSYICVFKSNFDLNSPVIASNHYNLRDGEQLLVER